MAREIIARRARTTASSSSAPRPASRSTPPSVEPYTLERGERETGVPADVIREVAHAYAPRRPGADLLDARHHRAPQRRRQRPRADQPRAAHRPRRPLRLGPEPAARPEQRAGRRRHGRHPEQAARLPGHRARRRGARASSSRPGASTIQPRYGWHLTRDVRGDGARRAARALRASARTRPSPRPTPSHAKHLLEGLDHLVVQDIFLTATARAGRRRAAGIGELVRGRGHRHQQRAARAAGAQGARPARRGPRRHRDHVRARRPARPRLGPSRPPRQVWNELRSLSPMHAGMSYARLEQLGGIQWPCYDEEHAGRAVPARPAVGRARRPGRPAPFNVVEHEPPVDELSDEFPLRLTTGRRLDSYNTGVQTGGYSSPLRRGETLDLSPEDAERARRGRRRARAGHVAARDGGGAGAHRPRAARRAWRS